MPEQTEDDPAVYIEETITIPEPKTGLQAPASPLQESGETSTEESKEKAFDSSLYIDLDN